MCTTPLTAIVSLATVTASLAVDGPDGSLNRPEEYLLSSTKDNIQTHVASGTRIVQGSVGSDCVDLEPASWLNPIPRRLETCAAPGMGVGSVPCSPLTRADINCDGREEYLWGYSSVTAVANGQAVDIGSQTLKVSEVSTGTSGTYVRYRPVFPVGTAVGDAMISSISGVQTGTVYLLGWRDMDGDSDLDLLCYIAVAQSGSCCQEIDYWFENIGYEKPAPPIAADINGDGRVDGADLGLLLVAWGPNP